jgi:hypothetical protein
MMDGRGIANGNIEAKVVVEQVFGSGVDFTAERKPQNLKGHFAASKQGVGLDGHDRFITEARRTITR